MIPECRLDEWNEKFKQQGGSVQNIRSLDIGRRQFLMLSQSVANGVLEDVLEPKMNTR